MRRSCSFWGVALLLAGVMAAPSPAHGDLDPGTVSYLCQILIAALVGGLFAIKIFWVKIKLFFLRLFGKAPREGAEGADDVEPVGRA